MPMRRFMTQPTMHRVWDGYMFIGEEIDAYVYECAYLRDGSAMFDFAIRHKGTHYWRPMWFTTSLKQARRRALRAVTAGIL